uniref:Olfactory receptor n=1 Tax=Castor canadensis TaxID=51338 RepID=A0A8C0WPT2_CASCN
MENRTDMTEFILLGLTNVPELQVPFFIVMTLIYLMSVVGNLGMILLILLDSHLHTPMYIFLGNLSLVDFGYSSAVTPTVLAGFLMENKVISYNACAVQMFFFAAFATIENFLLASMAYDRFAAVCKPLHYATTMTTGVCAWLVIGCHVCGFLNASIHTGETFSLSFCKSNVVHHFFCDVPAVMALSCSDAHGNDILFIFTTLLKMRSTAGYQKAFSTCASHLTAVSIFHGTIIFMYLQPSSSHSMDNDKIASVFYTMVIPMLNPVVYSLRNKEVKNAFKKVVLKDVIFSLPFTFLLKCYPVIEFFLIAFIK